MEQVLGNWLESVAAIIRALPPDVFWMLVFMLVVLLAFTLSVTAVWFHTWWTMRRTPTVMVRSALDGYNQLAGRLEPLAPGGTIHAPFSGQPCVWYRVRIQQLDLSLSGGLWIDLFMEEEQRPCILRDGSGICIVDTPLTREILGRKRDSWTINLPLQRKSLPHPLQGMERLGTRVPLRFVEERLQANAPGYAIGDLHTVRYGNDSTERVTGTAERWKAWRTDYVMALRDSPEQLAPNPADITLDPDTRRKAIPAYARSCGIRGKWFSVLSRRESLRHPFLVAGGHQHLLGQRLRRRALIAAAVVALLATPLVLLLLVRFGLFG